MTMTNAGQFKKGTSASPATQFKKGQPSPRKGVKLSDEVRAKISASKKGYGSFTGKRHSEETKKKISEAKRGTPNPFKGKKWPEMTGKNNPKWVGDRSKLKRYGDANRDRRSPAYADWRNRVWARDKHKCKIANKDCHGRIESHHILGWTEYVELRYEINNGITLCHAHHPRKRAEEKRLAPYFTAIVTASKATI